jgi:hypothetical protein
MEHNQALGPDDFLVDIYQKFCDTNRGDMLQLFRDLYTPKS